VRPAALLAVLLLLPGCGLPRRSADPVAADREIVRDLSWKYLQDARFKEVRVACAAGVVTLTGVVTTEVDKGAAEDLARRTLGVRDLRSELKTRSR